MAYDSPHGLIAMSVILEFLTLSAVILRFVSRRQCGLGQWVDDWLILVGFVFATALFVVEVYGGTTHALAVPLSATIADPLATTSRFLTTKHLVLAFFLLGISALTFVKVSVVLLYRRIFSGRGWFGIASLVWIVVISLWGVAFVIAALLECGTHLGALFDTSESYYAYCGRSVPIGRAMVIADTVTDVGTLLLPVPMIYKLQCPIRRKIAVGAIFAIGLLSVAASLAKAIIYIKSTFDTDIGDPIILITAMSVWNYVEIMVGIIAACAVTFRPVISSVKARSRLNNLLSATRRSLKGDTRISDSESEHTLARINSNVNGKDSTDALPENRIGVEKTYSVYTNQGRAEAGLYKDEMWPAAAF